MTKEEIQRDERYLRLLSDKFPNIPAAATEIVNLEAIMSLPKGTEHFLSDLHGEDGGFKHVLKNASGAIRRKVSEAFGDTLTNQEKDELCALIYYPEERIAYLKSLGIEDYEATFTPLLNRVVDVARTVTIKYTRSKVRKRLPQRHAYVMEELLHESANDPERKSYYQAIIHSIVSIRRAEVLINAFCHLIHHLVIDKLHIVGDIYDRGPGAYSIMEHLMSYHDYDIQWGNHDIEWMGAAAGNRALIASVLRVSIRYANVETLEEGYSINLLPLATFAIDTYGNDPCSVFQTKDFENNPRLKRSAQLMAKMHKAISIIQFKLEGQLIQRHPEYKMDDRLFLHLIDKEKGMLTLNGVEYKLLDTELPTLNPEDPYALSHDEELLMQQLEHSFLQSEKLQQHLRCLYQHGSLFLVRNNMLLFHAAIPMNADGSFTEVELDGKPYSGKVLYQKLDEVIRAAYYDKSTLDYMWYLWCGPLSPLFNKDKMTTFERYFLDDKELYKETKGAFFELANTRETCEKILREFGLDPSKSHIVNGHVPVRTLRGESPLRAGGIRLVIDGGFSKPYQAQTGISGYTLVYDSHGLELVEHEGFSSLEEAIRTGRDIHNRQTLETFAHRLHVRDTDPGLQFEQQIKDLESLLEAYRHGIIQER